MSARVAFQNAFLAMQAGRKIKLQRIAGVWQIIEVNR